MAVDDFLRALDSIASEIREVPDVVYVEMSLTNKRISDVEVEEDMIDKTSRYIIRSTSRSINAHWESLCFDIGGPGFPFVWSPKRSEVYESFPQDLVNERESVEFSAWYYLDSWRSALPQHLLDRFPPDEDDPHPEEGVAAMVYQADMNRVSNVIRSVRTAWSLAPEAVIREFGDLTRLPAGPVLPLGRGDDLELWWPAVLLTLAVREVDVVLTAAASEHIPWNSIFDDLPEGGDLEAHLDAFDPNTWTVSLNPPSLMAATRCALRAFRRVAEATLKKPGPVAGGADDNGHPAAPADESQSPADKHSGDKFQWTPPMLEGHVVALLKEVEYPSERDAVAWIADTSGKSEPSRTTLRKTFAWQNRRQKTPKPRTTNEAQSGVSPAQNADATMSHEEVTNAVLDVENKLHRQLVDDERDAVVWTLQNSGVDEKDRDEAIHDLIQGFRSSDMSRN